MSNERSDVERLADSRMQVAVLHTALKAARKALTEGEGGFPVQLQDQITAALDCSESAHEETRALVANQIKEESDVG